MNKTLKKLLIADLKHAAWNPRTPDELAVDHPAMVELIASISAVGVITPLAVWECGKEHIVVAGNRRLEAARAAGLTEIPAQVYTGITEYFARKITRFENEVRRGVNPLEDAKLIESLVAAGASQKEIAAEFGVSEAMICRRMKLTALDPSIRAIADKFGNITTDALESIASYPAEIQIECSKRVASSAKSSNRVTWKDVSWSFSNAVRDLDKAQFPTDACVACEWRTGNQASLFGELGDGCELGKCLKCKCYEEKRRAHLAAMAKEIAGDLPVVDAGSVVIKVGDTEERMATWKLASRQEFSRERGVNSKAAWFFDNYGDLVVYFGPGVSEFSVILNAEEAERQANLEADRRRAAEEEEANKGLDEKIAAFDAAKRNLAKKFNEVKTRKLEKEIRSSMLPSSLSKAQREILAISVRRNFESYSFTNDDIYECLAAFPEFTKAIGIKVADMKAVRVARADVEKFKREISKNKKKG